MSNDRLKKPKPSPKIKVKQKTKDDLLEDMHNAYIKKVTESGIPLWVADLYSYGPSNC